MMVYFFKAVGAILGLGMLCAIVLTISAEAALLLSLFLIVIPGIALLKPMPRLALGSRKISAAMLVVVGIPMTLAAADELKVQQVEELAYLKRTNVEAYLERIKRLDQELWLSELAKINLEQHSNEVARIELDREKERIAETQQAALKAAEEITRKCGESNEGMAYVMSQHYVKQLLRAPSTAEFPAYPNYSSTALGNCDFKVSGYVDAQNGFGGMVRSRFEATMVHYPDEGSWNARNVEIF